MNFKKMTKVAAWTLGTVLTAGIAPMVIYHLADKASRDTKQGLEQFDIPKVTEFLQSQKQDKEQAASIQQNMDYHTALLFYCDPKISKKIAGLKSQDGHELVQEFEDHFVVWDADEKREERLEKILAEIDPETKTQICGTYSVDKNQLTFHFGGTDFSSMSDLAAATTSLTGAQNPRGFMGGEYAVRVVDVLQKKRPELKGKPVNTAIIVHSSGAASAPSAVVGLASKGFYANSVTLIDPCGASSAYRAVEYNTGISSELLEANTSTVKPAKTGPLDYFKQATALIGQVEMSDAEGHMGKHFVIAYNKARNSFK